VMGSARFVVINKDFGHDSATLATEGCVKCSHDTVNRQFALFQIR